MATFPTTVVIDSQSARSGLPKQQKGIEGGKKVKGIKRHIVVDSDGTPLKVSVTQANTHDSKAAYPLIVRAICDFPSITRIKADNGYRSALVDIAKSYLRVDIQCVKSNFGTSEFIPMQGRWVVERTIAWLDNFRRLARNYEQYLHTAQAMAQMAILVMQLPKQPS